jgi:two-component system CheB/CheR fusion protein
MNLTVHIIDDDDALRDSTRALLESYGHDVRDYHSAEAFLACSCENAGCLLVDYHMPGKTGLDLLEHLFARGHRMPALLMTGRNDPTIAARASRLGVKYLNKPVVADQLITWIEQAQWPAIDLAQAEPQRLS